MPTPEKGAAPRHTLYPFFLQTPCAETAHALSLHIQPHQKGMPLLPLFPTHSVCRASDLRSYAKK